MTTSAAWSEWLREASVLIAVFGGVIEPLFGVGPSVDPRFLPTWIADPASGRIRDVPWVLLVLLLSGVLQFAGLAIGKRGA